MAHCKQCNDLYAAQKAMVEDESDEGSEDDEADSDAELEMMSGNCSAHQVKTCDDADSLHSQGYQG